MSVITNDESGCSILSGFKGGGYILLGGSHKAEAYSTFECISDNCAGFLISWDASFRSHLM